ncbi:MAG: RIFT barrel domain-containing protein [Candidatus Latescibacterota bacterium]
MQKKYLLSLLVSFFLFGFAFHAVSHAGETIIRLEETVGLDRQGWPAGFGFPFNKGELRDITSLAVVSPDGRRIPVQAKVMNSWPDGSVRWAHVFFLADMKAQQTGNWKLVWGGGGTPPKPTVSVKSETAGNGITVNTGALEARIGSKGFRLFESVKISGRELLAPGTSDGFRIITADGKIFESAQDSGVRLSVEESGPLRAIIRADGVHRSREGGTLFDYTCRAFFYAGKPWCEVEYRFTNREAPDSVEVASLSLITSLSKSTGTFRGTTSEYKIDKFWDFDKPFRIYSGTHDFFGVFGGAVMYRQDGSEIAGMGYESEARARWWADASDGSRGLTASIQDMSQNYPKGIRVHPDSIVTDLYPPTEKQPLIIRQGWSKTHTVMLFFHTGDAKSAQSRELCFSWQAPIMPWSPRHIESGLLGDVFPYSPKKYPLIERALRAAFVSYESGVGRGMIDYGDTRGAGSGERGNFMQNNAYDTPWVSWLMFLRSGEQRYWTRAFSAALHTADIDIVHHSTRTPVEVGGVRIHGPNHVQYNAEAIEGSSVAPNHEWVEGLLLNGYLTGDRRYRDLAIGMADHILKAIDAGWIGAVYNAKWNGGRNLGWPLLILGVMYDDSGDKRYLEGGRKILAALREIQMENGSFPIVIGPYKAAAPLHNAILMEALGRYHAFTGDQTAKEIYLKCAESTLRDLSFPDGELMYITHPDYRSGYASMPWGGYHFGYLYTGDKKFLEFPYPLIRAQIQARSFGAFGEGALAYPLRGILFYLYQADRAGILKDLPK